MQAVYSPSNAAEAHMLVHMLAQHGVGAHVFGEQLQGAVGDLPSSNFIRVMVADEDFEAARRLIVAHEAPAYDAEDAAEPAPQRGWVATTAGVLLAVIAFSWFVWMFMGA